MFSLLRPAYVVGLAAGVLSGCVAIFNQPVNQFAAVTAQLASSLPDYPTDNDSTIIGLGFSGGGTRAAAFAYGMLKELEATPIPGERGRSMLHLVRFVSGVSGGAIAATYYGLKGPEGYDDFRQKFLTQNGEATMRTSVGLGNFVRALKGGVNNDGTFAAWLDANVYDGARFADMWKPGRPVVWINATDIYNHVPFLFNEETFQALCSNLGNLPIAEAVAASAAVPVVFSPTVLQTFGTRCPYKLPAWLKAAAADPNAPTVLTSHAEALESYRDPEKLKYVKLVDGGVTDNFGVTGLTLARAQSQTPYGPFSVEQAVRLDRVIYIEADAAQFETPQWTTTVKGPALIGLMTALTDTAIDNSVRAGYDVFRSTMHQWLNDLVAYRCGLSDAEVLKYRKSLDGWDCRNLKAFIFLVSSADLDPAKRAAFNKIPTRLALPLAQVDLAIAAGREGLRSDPGWRSALKAVAGIDVTGAEVMLPTTDVRPDAPNVVPTN
jgi:NTE family protein